MDTIISVCLGLGLAAACGLRVFVPMFLLSVGAKLGMVDLSPGFAWLASWAALSAFGAACVAEIAGYYIPWVDNALDTLATPAAMVAGGVAAASQMGIIIPHGAADPALAWAGQAIGAGAPASFTDASSALAGLAQPASGASWSSLALGAAGTALGGGLAGAVQTGTVAARAGSTLSTGGVVNPILSTIENVGAIVLSLLAIIVPALVGIVLLVLVLVIARGVARRGVARRRANQVAAPAIA